MNPTLHFDGIVASYSDRPTLRRTSDAVFVSAENGPLWVLTDLATARALGMTPVSIENANGDFVAPTEQSMRAAVSTMTRNESGALVPDPNSPAGASTTGGVGAQADAPAYPLTFVQYGMTPAEPLVDTSTCTARSDSQALLSNWLNYVTGPGQEKLAAGLVALPDDLKAEAQAIPHEDRFLAGDRSVRRADHGTRRPVARW